MRGFQPAAHLVPKYADGGLVQRALGLFGGRKKQIDEAVKVASQDTRQASAPAPAPVKTTPDGKFDEKRASKDNPAGISFADGGLVRGPGTGTSDDVPDEVPEGTYIMPADSTETIGAENLERAGARGLPMPGGKNVPVALSNGEFKIPPEQVHAVGVQALDQIKNATHKPVRGFAPQAAPEQPRQFFANGGRVKRLHLADAGVVTQKRLEEEGQVPNAAPPAVAAPATEAQVRGLYQDWQDKKTPWYMPTPKGNMEERTAETAYTKALASTYAGGALQHQPGGLPPASPAQTTTQDAAPATTPAATPATATLNSALEAQRRRDAINGTGTSPSGGSGTTPPGGQLAQEAQAPQGREVVPGAYAHGRGQYSDRAGGMGFSAGFTGKPNAQNNAAAEALSARSQQESTNRLAQQQYQREVADAQAINAAGTRYAPNSGLQYQWMNDIRDPRTMALRNAEVGSRIHSNTAEMFAANKARRERVGKVWDAINAQMRDAQQADTARYQSNNTLAGDLATERMRQEGEAQRSARGFAVDQQRLGIEAGKAEQESTARDFDIRAAQRREGVLQRYDAAKTDQERAQLQRQYPDVFGREKNAQDNLSNNFMRRKVPVLDEQGRPTGAEREEIVDLRTSRVVNTDGGQAAQPPAAAIQALRADPKRAAEFDAKFGQGASSRFLNG